MIFLKQTFKATKMYGLIIEAIVECIKTKYGERVWQEVKSKSKVDQDFFNTHQQYSEAIVQKVLRNLAQITSKVLLKA